MALWNRLSFPYRLFLWLLSYSVFLMGCFIAFQYHREKEFKSAELNARLQDINTEILEHLDDEEYKIHPMNVFSDLRVTVIDTLGNVLYDSSIDETAAVNHLSREEVAEALKTGSGYTVRRISESTGDTYFYSATLGGSGKIVRTAVPYSVSLRELLEADMGFLWVMGGTTLIICVIGFFATRRLGLNILRLNRFAESAERGERIYDTAPFPQDELGSISNHIVRLYSELQQAIADRDREHKSALYQQREKELIKKRLTNNINHELKTPVSSIQVCLEILLAHDELSDARRKDFLQRCMSNAERLRRLLSDVAQITRMDDAPAAIAKEELNLSEIIAETVADCEMIAENHGMEIANGIMRPLPMKGNRSLLTSVFRNLIDNAIAYSGGSRIRLHLISDEPGKIVLEVSDNGSGVPPEHLPHLFERFYRIDKGRSRAAGGTGLGLSIVKNAVLMHNGTITVDNLITGGLAFTITFITSSSSAPDVPKDSDALRGE